MNSTQLTKYCALGLLSLSACRTTVIEAPSDEAVSAAITTAPEPDAPIRIVVPSTTNTSSSAHSATEAVAVGTKSEGKEEAYVDKKLLPFMVKMTIDASRIQDEINEISAVYSGTGIPDANLKSADTDSKKRERESIGLVEFKVKLLGAYAVTDANWLLLEGRAGEDFMNNVVLASKDPARTMALHRLAFKYAFYDTEGLDVNHAEAIEFADSLIKEKSPELYLMVHKAALVYAVYESEGLKRSIVEGRDFAKKVASKPDGEKILNKHRDEFMKAKKSRDDGGQGLGATEALRIANEATNLN